MRKNYRFTATQSSSQYRISHLFLIVALFALSLADFNKPLLCPWMHHDFGGRQLSAHVLSLKIDLGHNTTISH